MTRNTLTTLDELWQAAMPSYTAEEQRAGIVLLRELSKGEPITTIEFARALKLPTAEAERLLAESALRPFVYDGSDSRIEGFWGLSTKPTHHRFTIGKRTLWTWCAQDSLFLPELLAETAHVESTDPDTGEPVRLTISPTRIEAAEPESIAVSLISADATDFSSATRIITTACHYIFFFAGHASGERWVAGHPQTTLVSLGDAFALARRQNARVFGEELTRRSRG